MKKITVAIVDDHKLIREMWTMLFASKDKIEVIIETGELEESIELIRLKQPDIILLDINFPKGSGLDVMPRLKEISPLSKIIVITMHNQPAYVKKMMRLGAKAYITKDASNDEMFKAIDVVMKGGIYLCKEISESLAKKVSGTGAQKQDVKELSMREIDVVKLIKDGFSSKAISEQLKISIRTVELHRHNILKKLNSKNTVSLINYINTTDLSFN